MLALLSAAAPLGAQEAEPEPPPRPRRWTGKATANGNAFFGNVEQLLIGGRLALARADSNLAIRFDGQFFYGEQADDEGERRVNKRLWLVTATSDWLPYARWSPFVFGTFESSLEKQIAARYSGGVGAKRTYVRTERTEASLSGALLYERTEPLGVPTEPVPDAVTRLSWRVRVRHQFDDRLRLAHVTFWQPSVTRISRYLVRSTTEAAYRLTKHTSVSLQFIDSYDSDAKARGAREYNDGQVLFGVTTEF